MTSTLYEAIVVGSVIVTFSVYAFSCFKWRKRIHGSQGFIESVTRDKE
jgi:hypothetical protein